MGPTLIGAVGRFEQGDFTTKSRTFCIKDHVVQFDGREVHDIAPYVCAKGSARISFIGFSHPKRTELADSELGTLRWLGFPIPRAEISSLALKGKYFLDMGSSNGLALTEHANRRGLYTLQPLSCHSDLLLEDNAFNFVMRLAWSGLVGLASSIRPFAYDPLKFDDKQLYLLHQRVILVLVAIYNCGGAVTWACPSTLLSQMEPFVTNFFKLIHATFVLAEPWFLAASHSEFKAVGCANHGRSTSAARGSKRSGDGVHTPHWTQSFHPEFFATYFHIAENFVDACNSGQPLNWALAMLPPVLATAGKTHERTKPLSRRELQRFVIHGGGLPSTGD